VRSWTCSYSIHLLHQVDMGTPLLVRIQRRAKMIAVCRGVGTWSLVSNEWDLALTFVFGINFTYSELENSHKQNWLLGVSVCVCMFTYTHMCTDVYLYIYIYTHMHVHAHVRARAHTHTLFLSHTFSHISGLIDLEEFTNMVDSWIHYDNKVPPPPPTPPPLFPRWSLSLVFACACDFPDFSLPF